MFDEYIRVCAATPQLHVADPMYNARHMLALIERAAGAGAGLICLPELCVTGYTCGDLFLQETLLSEAKEALGLVVRESAKFHVLVVAGLPLARAGKLYNVAAVFCGGIVLGFVPKSHLPNYGEFYELRHFSPAPGETDFVKFEGYDVPFGTRLIFENEKLSAFKFAVEICEDLWTPAPPSVSHAIAGATVIANISASDETIGKAAYRRSLVSGQSARLICGYIYADSGCTESSTDMAFAGHDLICENGVTLAEAPPFDTGWAIADIDLHALRHDRRKMNTFAKNADGYTVVPFALEAAAPKALLRLIDPHPFVPKDRAEKGARCEEILAIQVSGLAKRIEHTACKTAVVGISGGLDSCLALLVMYRAFKKLGRELSGILAVTMPCFGTTSRTKSNAIKLCEALGVSCREIDIAESVRLHLRDIGHPENDQSVVYENAQARIRTLILMDIANKENGLVVGTGDLSELALGWATYNGDHMSMYGVNVGVPKTLVRHIVRHAADTCGDAALEPILTDILATPVSPELLPPAGDEISQQTEELVGPYELHDFFLYQLLRWGRPPTLILDLACAAFAGDYTREVIYKWLTIFCRRFFSQQFKRSCLPDGPKTGSVSLSPRGDWRMPSDAVCDAWIRELESGGGPRAES
ncbi:NAD(+) synthase [Clostridia bacterium]|nr:NAD(+) synthase [Clostridia bacterium]